TPAASSSCVARATSRSAESAAMGDKDGGQGFERVPAQEDQRALPESQVQRLTRHGRIPGNAEAVDDRQPCRRRYDLPGEQGGCAAVCIATFCQPADDESRQRITPEIASGQAE